MAGIASLLEGKGGERVEAVMDAMAREFGVARTIPPHVSYHIGEYATSTALPQHLEALAAVTPPFSINLTGFGVFTGPSPVLYLTVVRAPQLMALHERVSGAMDELGFPNQAHYTEPMWVPHVTLAIQHLSREAFPPVAAWLRDQDLQFTAGIDNVVLAREGGESIVILGYHRLGGG